MDPTSPRPKYLNKIIRASRRYLGKRTPTAQVPEPEHIEKGTPSNKSTTSFCHSPEYAASECSERPYDQASLHYVHIFFNGFEEKPLPPLPQEERAMRCRGIYIPEYWKDKPLPPLPQDEMTLPIAQVLRGW